MNNKIKKVPSLQVMAPFIKIQQTLGELFVFLSPLSFVKVEVFFADT
jgi:hypothetical protein